MRALPRTVSERRESFGDFKKLSNPHAAKGDGNRRPWLPQTAPLDWDRLTKID